jgi:hypothetical protein
MLPARKAAALIEIKGRTWLALGKSIPNIVKFE